MISSTIISYKIYDPLLGSSREDGRLRALQGCAAALISVSLDVCVWFVLSLCLYVLCVMVVLCVMCVCVCVCCRGALLLRSPKAGRPRKAGFQP